MAPADEDDRDLLAAEYVLGTLSAEERAAVAVQLFRDGGLRRHVIDWERRLSPLAVSAADQPPRAIVESRIMERLGGEVGTGAQIVALRQSRTLWRGAAIAGGLLAAGLAAVMVLQPQPPDTRSYVAVLQSEGPGPAFVASIDLDRGTISVRRVGAEPQADKSYELWAVGGGRDKPQSLGVIEASAQIPAAKLGKLDTGVLGETVFAVSVEPRGGSPTGQPTGPVVFTGKLVPLEE